MLNKSSLLLRYLEVNKLKVSYVHLLLSYSFQVLFISLNLYCIIQSFLEVFKCWVKYHQNSKRLNSEINGMLNALHLNLIFNGFRK